MDRFVDVEKDIEITRREFDRLRVVRSSGITNMLDCDRICPLINITPEQHMYMIFNYVELERFFRSES